MLGGETEYLKSLAENVWPFFCLKQEPKNVLGNHWSRIANLIQSR